MVAVTTEIDNHRFDRQQDYRNDKEPEVIFDKVCQVSPDNHTEENIGPLEQSQINRLPHFCSEQFQISLFFFTDDVIQLPDRCPS